MGIVRWFTRSNNESDRAVAAFTRLGLVLAVVIPIASFAAYLVTQLTAPEPPSGSELLEVEFDNAPATVEIDDANLSEERAAAVREANTRSAELRPLIITFANDTDTPGAVLDVDLRVDDMTRFLPCHIHTSAGNAGDVQRLDGVYDFVIPASGAPWAGTTSANFEVPPRSLDSFAVTVGLAGGDDFAAVWAGELSIRTRDEPNKVVADIVAATAYDLRLGYWRETVLASALAGGEIARAARECADRELAELEAMIGVDGDRVVDPTVADLRAYYEDLQANAGTVVPAGSDANSDEAAGGTVGTPGGLTDVACVFHTLGTRQCAASVARVEVTDEFTRDVSQCELVYTIDWGDGSPPVETPIQGGPPGRFAVGQHEYAEAGVYRIDLTSRIENADSGGCSAWGLMSFDFAYFE